MTFSSRRPGLHNLWAPLRKDVTAVMGFSQHAFNRALHCHPLPQQSVGTVLRGLCPEVTSTGLTRRVYMSSLVLKI